jgi:hypothetical protein
VNKCAVGVLGLLLAGCMSSGEMAQECSSYGFSPGTEYYAACRMQLAQQQRAEQLALGAVAAGAIADGALAYSYSRY